MKIAIGCDPNATEAKNDLINFIQINKLGDVTDFGSDDSIYANVAINIAEKVALGEYDRGILICGTGIGVSIAANKVKGAYCGSLTTGKITRQMMVKAFLTNEFVLGTRSQPKVEAYKNYDRNR